jgi:hypothetical protein
MTELPQGAPALNSIRPEIAPDYNTLQQPFYSRQSALGLNTKLFCRGLDFGLRIRIASKGSEAIRE